MATGDRWCILRTSAARTLPLTRSLEAAGFEVWTPETTIRRAGRKDREVQAPILPTFVFAREDHLQAVAAIAVDRRSKHPAFSVFARDHWAPLIRDSSLNGLRTKEQADAAAYQALLDGETREEARRARVEMMRTEEAKRKAIRRALRAERPDLPAGSIVTVADVPALAGLVGEVREQREHAAVVAFGGSLIMTIEAWRLLPNAVDARSTGAVSTA